MDIPHDGTHDPECDLGICTCHDPEHDADPDGADGRGCVECGCTDSGAPDDACGSPAGCCHRGIVEPQPFDDIEGFDGDDLADLAGGGPAFLRALGVLVAIGRGAPVAAPDPDEVFLRAVERRGAAADDAIECDDFGHDDDPDDPDDEESGY